MPSGHMSAREIQLMDAWQKAGRPVSEICAELRAQRARKGATGPGKTAVYEFLRGNTYVRGKAEARGRKSKHPQQLVRIAGQDA